MLIDNYSISNTISFVHMSKLNLKPTSGYLLIEPLEKEVKTVSGIYLPENSSEKPQKGKVIATGPKTYQENHEVESPAKVGDTVLYKNGVEMK